MFAEIKSDLVKEQITRVLLERLIVNRPHPWVSGDTMTCAMTAKPFCVVCYL